ncbi:hypothetical protein D9M68_955710 [compost metagenome]
MARGHGYHRQEAVGDVVAQGPGEADDLAAFHRHGHALGIGHQPRELVGTAYPVGPAIGDQ